MKWMKGVLILIFVSAILSSCDQTIGCPDGEIDWVDMLMIDGVKYQHQFVEGTDEPLSALVEKGKPLGVIKYKMANKACSDHKMKNSDAAFLEIGTTVNAVKGYPTSLMVVADEKVYVAETNNEAKTIGELYLINNLVKNIYIESTEDGSRIHTLSPASTEAFLDEWLQLELVDYMKMVDKNVFEGERVFLEIELTNGVSFRQLYWSDSNTFQLGAYGNNGIQETINKELADMKN